MLNAKKPYKVAVLLFPKFSNHCLANAIEPLRAANTLSGKTLYEWTYLSADGEAVNSSSGLQVQPEYGVSEAIGGDMLMVMPSYGFEDLTSETLARQLRVAAEKFDTLAGLDTGAWMLAQAGLLEQARATIHWDELDRFAEAFPDVDVRADRWVIDGNRLSCGGVTTTLELMLEVINRQFGALLMLQVASLFMLGETQTDTPLLRLHGDSQVAQQAAAIMRRNIERPLTIVELAKHLGLSKRALEGHFRKGCQTSPAKVYRSFRLREARSLSEKTNMSVSEIATRCGYEDASALSRAFRAEFGMSPREARANFRA